MARKTGKLASLYLGVAPTRVGELFDWTFETNTENLVASIKGDAFERFVPSHNSARITAQRYLNTSAIMTQEVRDAAFLGEQITFRLDLIDGSASFSQLAGTGYFSRGALTAPRGAVVEDFEIIVDGEWAVTLISATDAP